MSQKNGKFALRADSTFYATLVMNDHQQDNRYQKMQLSRIPDGDVHDFHHKTYYLAIEEFERESFCENVLLVSVVCLSHSLSVVLLTSLFIFWGLVLCLQVS